MTDHPPLVRAAISRGVATITLNSPHNRNALSTPMLAQLREALGTAVADPAARVLVLDHTGPAFCSGVDLAEIEQAREAGQLPVAGLPGLLAELWECPKPVVARIAGAVRAGGIGLVAAADLAIATTDATFAFNEVRIGVVPAVISATVLPLLTARAASRLYLTGEVFDAEHAAAVGLISEAVPASQLDHAVTGACDGLVRGAPNALAGVKELLRHGRDIRPVLRELSERSAGYFRSDEAREGIAAFRERRAPQWLAAEPGTDVGRGSPDRVNTG